MLLHRFSGFLLSFEDSQTLFVLRFEGSQTGCFILYLAHESDKVGLAILQHGLEVGDGACTLCYLAQFVAQFFLLLLEQLAVALWHTVS